MNKQDEERVREIAREEAQKWYVKNVVEPTLRIQFKLSREFFGHGKAQAHESESIPHNQS